MWNTKSLLGLLKEERLTFLFLVQRKWMCLLYFFKFYSGWSMQEGSDLLVTPGVGFATSEAGSSDEPGGRSICKSNCMIPGLRTDLSLPAGDRCWVCNRSWWSQPIFWWAIKSITFHCFRGKEMEKLKANKSKDEGKEEIPLIWNTRSRQRVAVKKLHYMIYILEVFLLAFRNQLCDPLLHRWEKQCPERPCSKTYNELVKNRNWIQVSWICLITRKVSRK